MSYAPKTENLSADLAREIAAALSRSEFKPGKVEDLGSSARLEVRTGSRRQPGDPAAVVDTERCFAIAISELPEGQFL